MRFSPERFVPAGWLGMFAGLLVGFVSPHVEATPTNRAAMARYYDRFLTAELNRCVTCHIPSPIKDPASLDEFPHNVFGERLRQLGEEWEAQGRPTDVVGRLEAIAREDADGDGVDNQSELLAGTNPGDKDQAPASEALAGAVARRAEFVKFLASYRWKPFEKVRRPEVPQVAAADWVRTPIDAFIAAEHEARGLRPRPPASKQVLLRRVYLDLIGLAPTPAELRAFEEDSAPDAYEKVVDRLLNDPRHGERWARHWMDIWRYSDWAGWTDGKQVRDSHRHIWRWRDWIVGALNSDRGYDRMVMEMLAGDELAPDDSNTLPATGFLVRNYKKLSREQWLEDTVKHTAQAFLGVTLGCAKCHDHRADPITQAEYYRVRAIFEPHQVRTDRVPGELDTEKDGLPRVYDEGKDTKTYFLKRGDERTPDKDRVMEPGVPKSLGGVKFAIAPVSLPKAASSPDRREFVLKDLLAAGAREVEQMETALGKAEKDDKQEARKPAEIALHLARARQGALSAVLTVEEIEERDGKMGSAWEGAVRAAVRLQRDVARLEARQALQKAEIAKAAAQTKADNAKADAAEKARKDLEKAAGKEKEAAEALAKAEQAVSAEAGTDYKPRTRGEYPAVSTGRRLAFARWLAERDHPLTARVAVNHLWLRHFGRGIITTPENFGSDGAPPSHPALLDWLAAEFMEGGWKMKALHRTIVTSSTYRMASTPDSHNAKADPDGVFLWRMPTRRMEAELVRDNVLYAAGALDLTLGGPEIDHQEGLRSRRRSLYFRSAAEKEMEFLKIFDGPSITECYQRRTSVMPQQALALMNSELALAQARNLAAQLEKETGGEGAAFTKEAFLRVLARAATAEELAACVEFLQPGAAPDASRSRVNLLLTLFNHHDFVTIR